MVSYLKLSLFLVCCKLIASANIPSQIHLSYGAEPHQMVVTWATATQEGESTVWYGTKSSGKLTRKATGSVTKFVDGGTAHHTEYIHRVTIEHLTYDTSYSYQVQLSASEKSKVYTFTTRKGTYSDWSPKAMVYGDMGLVNHRTYDYIKSEAEKGTFDLIMHNGDFAYDLHSENAQVGDKWLELMEPIAASYPYMTSVGNHEGAYNFSNYINRFSMPANENLWFSYDIGPAHIIVYSTEVYFFDSMKPLIRTQHEWLKMDLERANNNRKNVPWIIALGHRPFYCSNSDRDKCTREKNPPRIDLEPLYYEQGVDLVIEAHEHSYERTWPVNDDKVCKGSPQPYTNPLAPVHFITGSAGNQEHIDGFVGPYKSWSAKRVPQYGVARMHILNGTHIHWEQVSRTGATLDDVMLVQHNHGPFTKC